MRRGEVWTASAGAAYAGKPRPVAIVQDDAFEATGSVTICAFTTEVKEVPLFRVAVEPSEEHAFVNAFLTRWGEAVEGRRGRRGGRGGRG